MISAAQADIHHRYHSRRLWERSDDLGRSRVFSIQCLPQGRSKDPYGYICIGTSLPKELERAQTCHWDDQDWAFLRVAIKFGPRLAGAGIDTEHCAQG